MSIELFYSYAQEDEPLRAELEKHLSLLKRQGDISGWHNRDISAGKEWEQEIDAHLNRARIILLLVSPDFMASDYCYDIEVKRAMERHEAGDARVIPIILRPVDWHGALFGKLKALPREGKAVKLWPDRDDAFYNITQGIREVVQELSILSSSSSRPADLTSNRQKETQAMPPISHAFSSNDDTQALDRPATALLSYAREDAEEVELLQMQLKVRGVRAWRDVTDLPLGGATEEEIVHAIENVADAMIIYITPHSLRSDFVWEKEIPAALRRRERDSQFSIVPILKDVSYQQVQQQCMARGYRSLADFNAVRLLETEPVQEKLRSVAERVLKSTLALRLRRAKADQRYEPSIMLRTFKDVSSAPSLDLDLNWWDIFQDRSRLPSADEWRDILFPALRDVKNALGETPVSQKLHISLYATLPPAFALGYAFPAPARYTLLVQNKDDVWSTLGTADASPPFRRIAYSGEGDAHVAVVEIEVAAPTADGTTRYLEISKLSYRHHIRYELPNGPDFTNGVKDAAHALTMAQYIGKELRALCGKGITHIHLFAAIPAALAVLLGHQFNALCPVSLYQYVANREYEPACTLAQHVGEA